jgi:hypothetical protein
VNNEQLIQMSQVRVGVNVQREGISVGGIHRTDASRKLGFSLLRITGVVRTDRHNDKKNRLFVKPIGKTNKEDLQRGYFLIATISSTAGVIISV